MSNAAQCSTLFGNPIYIEVPFWNLEIKILNTSEYTFFGKSLDFAVNILKISRNVQESPRFPVVTRSESVIHTPNSISGEYLQNGSQSAGCICSFYGNKIAHQEPRCKENCSWNAQHYLRLFGSWLSHLRPASNEKIMGISCNLTPFWTA